MGYIYRASKGSKLWRIRYTRNGVRYSEPTRTTSKTKAQDLLRIREGDIAKGIPINNLAVRIRVSELLEDVVNDYITNGHKTLKDVRLRIKLHLEPYFGNWRASNVTTADVRSYITQRLEEGAKPASINRELAVLKRAFSLAMKSTPPRVMFKPYIPMLAENNVRKGFLEDYQYEEILRHISSDLRPVIEFARMTGWRVPSEVLPLQWKNVDFKNGVVTLDTGTTKNKEGRTFPMNSSMRELLEEQWHKAQVFKAQNRIVPWVFSRDGERIKDFREDWKNSCTKAGCPQMIVHDFRRTVVRAFERDGVSRSVAMKLTGHKTEAVYRRYAIVNEGDLREGVAKLKMPSRKKSDEKSQPQSSHNEGKTGTLKSS